MKQIIAILLLLISAQKINAQTTYKLDSTTLTSRTVIDSIDIPWEITWGPDNYIWMTERFGRVSRVNPATGQQQVLLNISTQVYDNSESGLLGLVLHPNFSTNPFVYIVYTYLSGSNILERLERYTYNGTNLSEPLILLDNIAGNTTHIGSRLFVLPDNTLLMSTGDAQNQSSPQNKSSLSGKILRLNLDGSVPADNPIPNSLVWSFGHRNTQGIWRAPNGIIYISEHGPTSDDELSILKSNRNYGWPTVNGYCNTPPEIVFCDNNNVVEPIAVWTPTIAPSDIIWYNHAAIPEFKDRLLMTVLKDKELRVFNFNSGGDSVISEKSYFKNAFGRLRDICISPSGKIYLATNGPLWNNSQPFTHSIIELSNNKFTNTIQKKSAAKKVKIGPNPISAGQPLIIELARGESGKIALYDLSGQLVFSQTLNEVEQIPLALSKGIYTWKINFANGNFEQGKLIAQ